MTEPAPMISDDLHEWLRKSCEASDVPLKVEDPATIRKIATILATAEDES